jgi:hypothetical protein
VLLPAPSLLSAFIGGLVGTELFIAVPAGAAAWSGLGVNAAAALGSMFVSNGRAALAIGLLILVVGGTCVMPALLVALWSVLPGDPIGFGGALMKGVACGAAVWIVYVLAIGGAGMGIAAVLLIASMLYGVAVAVIAAMERAVSPLDTLGWRHHYHGSVGGKYLNQHRSIEINQSGNRGIW